MPCQRAIQLARQNIGLLVNAENPQQSIYFCSCGSEADNRAIDIALHHYKLTRPNSNSLVVIPKIISTVIEHPAILLYLRHLENNHKIVLELLPVNGGGLIDLHQLSDALTTNTALVTVMHSNNEVGSIQPMHEIGNIINQFNQRNQAIVLLHSDAAQSLGKVIVDVEACRIDILTIVGHKFGAPKGIAALYIRNGIKYVTKFN